MRRCTQALILACVALAACKVSESEQLRLDYTERFPELYCAWLETCPDGGMPPADCVAYYTRQAEAALVYETCYSETWTELCIQHMDPTHDQYQACEEGVFLDYPIQRPRLSSCERVSWQEPCEYSD